VKKFVSFALVAGLLAGCGEEAQKKVVQVGTSPEEKRKGAEEEEAMKIAQSIGWHDYKIIAEAIDFKTLQDINGTKAYKKWDRGKGIVMHGHYAPNEQTPYTGWVKWFHATPWWSALLFQVKDGKVNGSWHDWYSNGQKKLENTYKNGKLDGLRTRWYFSGQKMHELIYKEGKLVTAVAWKINGEKCPHTKVMNGNGVVQEYSIGRYSSRVGTLWRDIYKDGRLWAE